MPAPTIHWNLNADGNWETAADWTRHRLPGATDDVSINTADLHTIKHSTGTDTVNTLTVGNDNLVVSGGSLRINSTSSFANLLAVSGGTLALGGNATAASFTQSGGTVSGASTLTVTGPTVFSGMSLETGPGTTILKGATTFANNPAPAFDGGRILENQGTLTLLDAQEIDLGLNPFGRALGGGTLKNDAGGTIIMGQASFIRPGAGAAFINAGTLASKAGSGGNVIGAPLTNTGKILAQSGEMNLFGFTNSGPGTISISSGASLALDGSGGSANASAFTVAAGGKLDFFPGNHTPGLFTLGAGTIHGTGTVAVDGGELALGAGAVTVTNFSQGINSTVSGSGTLTITGVAGGIVFLQTGPGTTLLTASSLFGFGPFNLDGGRVLENQGSGDLGNITLGANPFGPSLGGGTIKNDAGGTLSISGYVKCLDSGTIENDAGAFLSTSGSLRVVNGAGANSFINAGTFEKFFLPNPVTGQDITVGVIGVNFTDTGVIRIDGGTLEFTGASNSFAGSISTVGNGLPAPTLAFAGGTSALNSGTTITVPQWSLSDGAVVNLNETLDFTGLFSQKDAGTTLNVAAGHVLRLTGGGAELAGAVGGAGTVSVLSGTIANLRVGGSAKLIDTSGVDQNGTLILGDAGAGAATLSIGAGATYSIDNNWDIARGASLASSIQNGGLLIKAGGTGTSVIGVAIADAGSIEAGGGTLDLTQAITGAGSLAVFAGATLEADFSAAATLTATFKGANATLALLDPSQFAATIGGFASTDTIHLLARTATSATLEAGDKLVIADGSSTVATLQLAGNFTGDAFHVASDGTAGTLVTVSTSGAATPPAALGVSGAGHRFIAAMAGLGAGVGGPMDGMSAGRPDAWRPALSAPGSVHFA